MLRMDIQLKQSITVCFVAVLSKYVHMYKQHTTKGEKICNLIKFVLQHLHSIPTCEQSHAHIGTAGKIRRISCTTMSRYARS